MVALFMLLWQWPGLASGAVAVLGAPSAFSGKSERIAQGSMPGAKGIPAEVHGWFDAMREQADKGNGVEALRMHEKVMAWVRINLPEEDIFRARVMVRYGYILDKIGKYQDALIPARDGVRILRQLAESSPEPDARYFLTIALNNLGRRHAKLEQTQAAAEVFQEGLSILRILLGSRANNRDLELLRETLKELSVVLPQLGKTQDLLAEQQATLSILSLAAKTQPMFQDAVADIQVSLGDTYSKLGRFSEAQSSHREALEILRDQAKGRGDRRFVLKTTLNKLMLVNIELGQLDSLKSIWSEMLPIVESELLEARKNESRDLPSRQILALSLMELMIVHNQLGQSVQSLHAAEEAMPLIREIIKADPANKWWQSQQVDVLKIIASSYLESGHTQKIVAISEELFPLLREVAKTDPSKREELVFFLVSLGKLYGLGLDTNLQFKPYFQEALTMISSDLPSLRQQAGTRPVAAGKLAKTLHQLSVIRSGLGNAQQAIESVLESIRIYRNLAKTDSGNLEKLADALEDLAGYYQQDDQLERALQTNQEAVQALRKLVIINPSKKLLLAKALLNLSNRYRQVDKPQQGLSITEEAVFILREIAQVSPNARRNLAKALGQNLFDSYLYLSLHRQALQVAEESVRLYSDLQENGLVADWMFPHAMRNVGLIRARLGQWQQSLLALEESVNLSRQQQDLVFGGRFFHNASLIFLALPYNALGRRQEALAISRQAIQILEGKAPADSNKKLIYTGMLQILAESYADLGLFDDALPPMLQAVHINKTLGETSGEIDHRGQSLVALARLYGELGRDQEVLAITDEALTIFRNRSGHPGDRKATLASALILKGSAHHNLGESELAHSSTKDAIRLLRSANTEDVSIQLVLARALANLGRFLADDGQTQQARPPAQEAVVIARRLALQAPGWLDRLAESSNSLAIIALRQGQSSFTIDLLKEAITSEVRFLQQQLPLMPDARRQSLVDTLERRWEIPFSLAQQGEDGASLAMFTRLNRHSPLQDIERRQAILSRSNSATRDLVSQLSLLNTQISNPTLSSQGRKNALAESEQLQEKLYRQLPALQPSLVEIAEVARQLPADAALVEFQRFSPYDATKPDKEAWGKPRYIALLLDLRGRARAVDLGEADVIDQAIASAFDRTRLQQPGADSAWALVAEKLFSPLRGALEGKRQLLLSPDGQLHRVPFSALALLAGSTPSLPTTLTLHTISSGRDLVTASNKSAPASAPLVLADPATTGWAPLARAASEGEAVAASLRTRPLLGSAASVAVLERARGPRVLHVAGHGYFDSQATGDPLLASGLSLAGADKARLPSRQSNPQSSTTAAALGPAIPDDGYLTAKEAARLQLVGTDLVVLSSCESGLGSERSGEGLFGLQRALTVAGARGTLLSLWKVPEHATETFMTRFYALLGQGVRPAEAVRRVQAEFRAQPRIDGWSDPFYWAGWQYSGLPDSLR